MVSIDVVAEILWHLVPSMYPVPKTLHFPECNQVDFPVVASW